MDQSSGTTTHDSGEWLRLFRTVNAIVAAAKAGKDGEAGSVAEDSSRLVNLPRLLTTKNPAALKLVLKVVDFLATNKPALWTPPLALTVLAQTVGLAKTNWGEDMTLVLSQTTKALLKYLHNDDSSICYAFISDTVVLLEDCLLALTLCYEDPNDTFLLYYQTFGENVAREPFDFVLDVSNSEEVYNILIWALKLMIVLVGANEFNMIEHYDSLWNIGCKGLLLLDESIKLDIIQLLLCLCGDHALVTCHLDYLLNSILYNLEPSTRSLCSSSNIDNGLSQLLSQTFGCLDFSAEQYKFLHLAPCILQSSTNFLLKKSICKLMRHLLCSCPPDLAYATVIALMPLTNDITIHKAIIKCINIVLSQNKIPEYSKPTEESEANEIIAPSSKRRRVSTHCQSTQLYFFEPFFFSFVNVLQDMMKESPLFSLKSGLPFQQIQNSVLLLDTIFRIVFLPYGKNDMAKKVICGLLSEANTHFGVNHHFLSFIPQVISMIKMQLNEFSSTASLDFEALHILFNLTNVLIDLEADFFSSSLPQSSTAIYVEPFCELIALLLDPKKPFVKMCNGKGALTFSSHLTLPEKIFCAIKQSLEIMSFFPRQYFYLVKNIVEFTLSQSVLQTLSLRVVPMTIVGLQLKDKQDLINTIMRLYRSEDPQVRLYIASTLGLLCPIMNSGMVDETVNIHKIDTFVLKTSTICDMNNQAIDNIVYPFFKSTTLLKFEENSVLENSFQILQELFVDPHSEIRKAALYSFSFFSQYMVLPDHQLLCEKFVSFFQDDKSFNDAVVEAIMAMKCQPSFSPSFVVPLLLSHCQSDDSHPLSRKKCMIEILGSVGQSLSMNDDQPVFCIIEALLNHVLSPERALRATAYLQLVQISKTLGLKLKHLLRHFQERIASFLINNFGKMQPYLVDFCVTLMKILPEDFIIDALPLNLPQLVLERNSPVIGAIASFVKKPVDALILTEQTPLVTYILLHKEKTQDVFDTLQPYLAAGHERDEFLTNMDLGGILLQITLHFAVDEGKALDAMYDLMLLCERNATRNEERLADFLDSHFLKMEVLILKRTKGHFPTEDKKKLFVGLYHFLPLLGRHLPSFHDNIFIILTCGGPRWKTPESLLCLEVFIHNLPLWALKPLVTKLGAALISWLNVDRAKVASIIAYMVEHKKDLSGEIEKLVLPDNVEELQPIIASIYDTNRDSASRLKSILSLLNDSSNPTVKYQACCDLAKWLSNPKVLSSFYEKVCQQSIPSDLSEILSALLKTSRDPSVQIQVACSECLGKIGAVDPSQLELFATHLKPQEIDEPDKLSFAVTILNDYLYKFIAGTPNGARHCAFGYSIQMILRHLGITTGTHEEVDIADHFWHKFSPTAKATLSKYLSSDYSVSKPETTSFVDRLNSATDDLVHQWVATCTLNLIDTVERLPGESPGIFSFCKPALIYDINLCLYLFPWLVLNVARSDSTTDKTQLIGTLTSALQGSALQGREGANQNQECLKRCCLHVLGLFDWLNQWEADAKKDATKTKSKNKRRASQAEVNRVSEFVSQIKPLELAKAALSYHEYILAYMYLENHLRAEPESGPITRNPKINRLWHKARTVQDLFQPICFGLDDIDFLDGLQSWNVSMNPDKKLLYYEVKNQWAEALHYYQKSIRLDPSNQHLRLGRLKCLRNLGHWESVKIHLDSEHSNPPGSKDSPFTSSAISILWHLEKWDELGGLLSHCSITNMGEQHIPPTSVSQHSSPSLAIKPAAQGYIGAEWEQSLGRCLFLLHKGKPTGQLDEFDEQLRGLRSAVASSLAKASDSYQQAYPHLLQLHILQELEDCRNHIGIDDTNFKTFLSNWNMRLQATQGSYKTQEAILDVRRILFHILEQPQDTFIWRSLSKLSRYWGQLQSAVSIQENFVCPQVFNLDCLYEEIKLSCAKGQIEQTKESLHHLEKLAENGDNRILAKVKIQQAKLYFQEHETLACMEEPLKKAKECHPDGEKVYFTHAMFLDYHLQVYLEGYSSPKTAPLTPDQSSILAANINTLTCQAVEQYAQALRYGHKHSAHSFSRLLTLWCKFGSERDIKTFDYVQDTVKRLADTIPTYMWVSVLPQLTARIAHPNDNTYNVVSSLIKKALCEYPEQATWQVIGLCNASPKSSKTGKKSRYSRAQDLIQNQSRVFLETQVLSKALLRLCTTGEIKNKLSDDSKLSDLVTRWERSQKSAPVVIAPIKSALTVILPSSGKYDHGHTPFPGDLPLLYGLEKEIKVMPSMAKPKRITLKTNKGDLTFLCKPKDDLRRDARMLEFTTLVNKLLAKNPDARRRKLAVTTYAVVPLDDECGLLEWVHNLNGLRIIWSSLLANPLKPNAKNFYENIKRCPPVLHLWFRQQFLDPTEWFEARLRFIRSLAVMSMVGYIIGLGDRHGENLLLSNKADVVHVDFNCLFWQGESLATPEKVPYRLTPNLVDAMGIQGYEGPFRKVSELTLSIMRSNRDSLVSTLETFIFDPLAGFEGVSVDSRFKRLGRLLEGRVDDHTRELSVAAQVNITINTATNYDILSKMYAGWAPWV